MPDITKALLDIRSLERNASKTTAAHGLHPIAKLAVLVCYAVCAVSCPRYNIGAPILLTAYPLLLMIVAETPPGQLFGRLLIALPFVAAACAANLFLDTQPAFYMGAVPVSRGFLSFISALLKALLTVWGALLFIATTPVSDVLAAMRQLRLPDIIVTQTLLVYRYLDLLIREGAGMYTAYKLRAPGKKGVKMSDMGGFLGGMLLRAADRGERVYNAMKCRGYGGGAAARRVKRLRKRDVVYMASLCAAFVLVRASGAENLIGGLFY